MSTARLLDEATALLGDPNTRGSKPWEDELTDEEREVILELHARKYSAPAISRWLKTKGHDIGESGVRGMLRRASK